MIVLAQFAGTSLWFAGNAILPQLQQAFSLPDAAIGYVTSAVQLGFIAGTLAFALLLIADRFAAGRVFLFCAIAGALANYGIYWLGQGLWSVLLLRFLTGFFLAGIYPVGMKIAAEWFPKGLGLALGYLVGALVLGTAFPHLLSQSLQAYDWGQVLAMISLVAATGGLLLWLLVPAGPHRKRFSQLDLSVLPRMFQVKAFRSAAFGYFGHMWELYTFWAFLPLLLRQFADRQALSIPVSLLSFIVIATGSIGCIIGGYISTKVGSKRVAIGMLLCSGLCCLLVPVFFSFGESWLIILLLVWGFSVVGDSPQCSSLVAAAAPQAYVGSALTIVNGLGFGLTILSIELVNYWLPQLPAPYYFWLLLQK
ncbi:MAG: MFS transporter [Bacteroidota bacterium]